MSLAQQIAGATKVALATYHEFYIYRDSEDNSYSFRAQRSKSRQIDLMEGNAVIDSSDEFTLTALKLDLPEGLLNNNEIIIKSGDSLIDEVGREYVIDNVPADAGTPFIQLTVFRP